MTRRNTLLCVLACVFLTLGAAGRTTTITARMSLAEYMNRHANWMQFRKGNKEVRQTQIHVPVLAIYDPAGRLVFYGENLQDNVRVLESLPAGLLKLKPLAGGAPLSQTLDGIPEFRGHGPAILHSKRYTVFSTDLKGCKPCEAQSQAVDQLNARMGGKGVNELFLLLEQ